MYTEAILSSSADNSEVKPEANININIHSILLLCIFIVLGALAWVVVQLRPYEPSSGLGYLLGIVGGSAMLVLLLYPLRKHLRLTRGLGPLRYWFRLHMYCGLFGPAMILFHTGFHVGSINAAIALSCMVLVAASGIIGRFLYRRIHHGLYGSRVTLQESQQDLDALLVELRPKIEAVPELKSSLEDFMNKAAERPDQWWKRGAAFLLLGWRRYQTVGVLRRALIGIDAGRGITGINDQPIAPEDFLTMMKSIDRIFHSVHRTASFSTYERLFSLWHVAHVPFVYLFVLTAVVHVVAVHVY